MFDNQAYLSSLEGAVSPLGWKLQYYVFVKPIKHASSYACELIWSISCLLSSLVTFFRFSIGHHFIFVYGLTYLCCDYEESTFDYFTFTFFKFILIIFYLF